MSAPFRFSRILLLGFALVAPALVNASSRTEPPKPDEHLVVCGKNYLYIQNFNYKLSNSTSEAHLRATASVTVRHPKADPAGVRTHLNLRFSTRDFLNSVNKLFALHEYDGCDRLRYNHDAALRTVGNSWEITGNFKYEERVCTDLGSTTLFNTTRQVRITITPELDIVRDGSGAKLVTRMKATYDVPVFLFFSIDGDLFEFDTTEYPLPGIFAANLEKSEFSIRNSAENLYANTYITLRPLPAGVSCVLTRTLGDELWNSGDWGRPFGEN